MDMEEKLNCYDVYIEIEDCVEDLEVLVWAKSNVLARKYIVTELRRLDIEYDKIRVQKIEPDTALDYSCVQRLLELTDDIHALMEPNLSLPIDRQDLFGLLGLWVDKTLDCVYSSEYGKVKIANSIPVDAYKSILKDKDSDWYVPSTHGIHMRDIYNCLLHLIQKDDKDIVNQFEKTMLINNILGL